MMNEQRIPEIPAEKFRFIQQDEKIHDERIKTKPIGYFKDAWLRFVRNKSAVVAFVLIIFLVLFAVIVPFISDYDVNFRSGYYKTMQPKSRLFAGLGFWDGGRQENLNLDSYNAVRAIGTETGRNVIMRENRVYTDAKGVEYHDVKVDSYYRVGFAYLNLTPEEYRKLKDYQDQTGIQVIYPLSRTYNIDFLQGNAGANYWYQLTNEASTSTGTPALDENGEPIPNYLTSPEKDKAGYDSLRVSWDNGGEDGNTWLVYAQKNQSGYRVRVDYYEYFRYVYGQEPCFLFGTNGYGQDILTCLAAGVIATVIYILMTVRKIHIQKKLKIHQSILGQCLTTGAISAVILFITWQMASFRGIPTVMIWICLVLGIYQYITTKTAMGRHLYAVGGNEKATALSGVKTRNVYWFAYTSIGRWPAWPAY